jgi:hypothetical protein
LFFQSSSRVAKGEEKAKVTPLIINIITGAKYENYFDFLEYRFTYGVLFLKLLFY